MSSVEVVLGFLEEAESWRLRSQQFPSKVGGKPAWLSQRGLPSVPGIQCEKCGLPMVFLLQVYAPISGQDRSFHRTLFMFCCRTPECYTQNDSRCVKEEQPPSSSEEEPMSISGAKLCLVCGCPGNKACSRCHRATYCGKHHQTLHWKHSHKRECGSQDAVIVASTLLLFPESELITEPEEEEKDEAEDEDDVTKESVVASSVTDALAESELEEMAMHETEDTKVFQSFKKKIAAEPQQVVRYSRGGFPLWVSSQHVPSDQDIPACTCGAKRIFEFQVMPQLLNSLCVDSTGASVDWGTLAVYTCSVSCNQEEEYSSEFIWKQDFSSDQHSHTEHTEEEESV
uniref:MYND-type domain-containing protein n=1 Tax=Gouania willdenowi TaxID=441366 RepID=A0A8C5H2H7_GOUWI